MFRTMRFSRTAATTAMLAGALVLLPLIAWSAPAQGDSDIAGSIQKKLDKKQFSDVKVTVDNNGIATLTGSVDLFEYKMDAERRAEKVKGVKGVRDDIEVSGKTVPDQELQQKLVEKLQYDRVGYGNMFNAISVSVQNGEVTLGGHARTYVDRDSAVALASTFPGVKQVNDEIEVDPTSIMDDQTRLAVARAVYGYPSLNKYAIDPAKPIRISVQNGHVELAGVVDTKADKDVAGMRANGVSGVFSVKNDLQVAGQPSEKPEK
ncbi:MAG TPA: BON domain-containing protein [Terracidiphilus sp.]|nr:BON domain-containing protein [Terracidiphilus sp.]